LRARKSGKKRLPGREGRRRLEEASCWGLGSVGERSAVVAVEMESRRDRPPLNFTGRVGSSGGLMDAPVGVEESVENA
jgi:hypothetical protein